MSSLPLHIRGLCKAFGDRPILDHVDLQVAPGEIVQLSGGNGAGKTTLIRTAVGTLVPDAGTIEIGGFDLATQPLEARGRLRYLPQAPPPMRGVSGRELLGLYTGIYTDADQPSEASVAAAGLGDALDHLVSTYSVGMYRRLLFASLLCGAPTLVVLDEPFAGLDEHAAALVTAQIERWVAAGVGVLFSSHATAALGAALSVRVVECSPA